MNPIVYVALLFVGVLLGWDWLIKRRRIVRRSVMNDQEFLSAFRGPQETGADAQILDVRRRIARELDLPVTRLKPEDEITDLRDRYCLVVSGHLAIGDLLDDLDDMNKAVDGTATTPRASPETVREYIASVLAYSEGTLS